MIGHTAMRVALSLGALLGGAAAAWPQARQSPARRPPARAPAAPAFSVRLLKVGAVDGRSARERRPFGTTAAAVVVEIVAPAAGVTARIGTSDDGHGDGGRGRGAGVLRVHRRRRPRDRGRARDARRRRVGNGDRHGDASSARTRRRPGARPAPRGLDRIPIHAERGPAARRGVRRVAGEPDTRRRRGSHARCRAAAAERHGPVGEFVRVARGGREAGFTVDSVSSEIADLVVGLPCGGSATAADAASLRVGPISPWRGRRPLGADPRRFAASRSTPPAPCSGAPAGL